MSSPQIIQATPVKLDELLALAKPSFPAAQYQLLAGVLATFTHLMATRQNARSSIKRLRQMLFGAPTAEQAQGVVRADRPRQLR